MPVTILTYIAKKFSRQTYWKLFVGFILVSLVISIIGWGIFGFVVGFEIASVNPSLEGATETIPQTNYLIQNRTSRCYQILLLAMVLLRIMASLAFRMARGPFSQILAAHSLAVGKS